MRGRGVEAMWYVSLTVDASESSKRLRREGDKNAALLILWEARRTRKTRLGGIYRPGRSGGRRRREAEGGTTDAPT